MSTVRVDEHADDRGCLNWDEAVGLLASAWRDHHRGAERIDAPAPYFAALLERFLAGDPAYVARFVALWDQAPPMGHKVRLTYPVVWDHPEVGLIRFSCISQVASEPDGFDFHDWIPTDTESWRRLEELAAQRTAKPAVQPAPPARSRAVDS